MISRIGSAAGGEDIALEPSVETSGMLAQAEIVSFLVARGVEPLRDWRPGEPILYVIDDPFRTDTSHYGALPERLRPSVARLDDPDSVIVSDRAVDRHGRWSEIFKIVNESGGQVDYYAIDPDTRAIVFVKSSRTERGKTYPYVAQGALLFRTKDELFPKSESLAAD
ncbi:MAG TPA: hypothetical protein VKI45_02615 [Allosphingosinicella sp.]|nr:hypothetical protein [Allosphingosinicella sp.]